MGLADTLNKSKDEKKFAYTGFFRLVDKQAVPIPKIGDEYFPKNELQIEELEYQVAQGRVEKVEKVEVEVVSE